MQNTQNAPAIYQSPVKLSPDFPLHYRLSGKRSDEPVRALHMHDVLEIGLCLEGAGTYLVGGKVLPFKQGDVTIMTPLEWHRSQSASGTSSTWSWFFFDPVRLLIPRTAQSLPYSQEMYTGPDFVNVLAGEEFPELVMILQEMIEEATHEQEGFRDVIRALALAFLTRLHRRCAVPHPSIKQESPTRLLPALNLIAKGYAKPLKIEVLAKACNMSLRNFQLHFRKQLKQTPQTYLVTCRVQAAVAMLRATDAPITDIAFECGFGSLSNFNRAFRSHTGKKPSEFR